MNVLERDAYLYARVKTTMILRTPGDLTSPAGRWPRRLRLPAALTAASLLLLALLAGASGAGVSAYQGTLYFAGPASSLSGTWQLTNSTPAAQGVAPVATQGVVGSGGLATGSYRWIYVTSSGGALTASPTSNQLSVSAPGNTPVNVANVPVGADVYRATIPSGTSTGRYTYVGTNPGPTTTYTDMNTSTSGAALPQADNRVPLSSTGWLAFTPGTSLATSGNSSVSGSTPAIPATCSGWTVDSSAGFTFPAGTWTINAQVRPDAALNGAAVLSAAVWKIDSSGNTISGGTIVPVTDGGSMALNATSQTVAVTHTTSGATTLDTGERLCVQFWRHQTTATTFGGATSRTVWLLAYDPNSRISVHPAPNAFAAASLSSPADGTRSQTVPTLSATYSDAEGDAGTITLRLCSDSGCGTQLQTSGAISANNGDTKTWTPTGPLADATYYWQAQAQDSVGLASAWTSSRSFVIDNVSPTTTIDSAPPASSNGASGNFTFSANESVTGFQCRIDGAGFAACTSPHPYGPLSDGAHTFDVKATADLAGNAGSTTSHSWTIDTIPPNTNIMSQPASLSNSSNPSFSFTATQSGSTFECKLDGGGFSACSSPHTYSGVADGAHTFQVRAVDPAGNVDASPDSYSWTIDATPPDTSIGAGAPAALTTSTSASFAFSATESGSTFQCSLDSAAFAACSSPKSYSGLADGSHTFQVRATDNAANTDPTPASHKWTVDTTAPTTSIGPTMPPADTPSTSATFDIASNEAGSSFECRLDGAVFAPCTTPVSYTGLGQGSHTFDVRAIDPVGNLDATPASYTWRIDVVAPSTPTQMSPVDAFGTNALPQLRATFDDASPGGDTGVVEFQVCSSSAAAGSACAPLVQLASSGSVSNGGTGSAMPAALPDGTYHWQARARDAAGNVSGWSATRSFQLDTIAPTVDADAPADGATLRSVLLQATFKKPAFAGTGTVEFRICSDALCLGVVRSGGSALLVNGAHATWSPPTPLSDGIWYWQVRSLDNVGNASAWSPTRVLYIDNVAPGKPLNFRGQVDADGLRLRWDAPNDNVANYVLFVNGAAWKNLATSETDVHMGAFDATDTRTFSVLAIDTAGNVGAMSPVLVGVPDLVGRTWPEALTAATARGLELRRGGVAFRSIEATVSEQDPPAPALVARGSAVHVTLSAADGTPLALAASPKRVVCASGSAFRLRVQLSAPASVGNRLVNARGRVVKRGTFGALRAGTTKLKVKLPRGLQRGAYRLVLDAQNADGKAHAVVKVKVGLRACSAR